MCGRRRCRDGIAAVGRGRGRGRGLASGGLGFRAGPLAFELGSPCELKCFRTAAAAAAARRASGRTAG